MYCFVYFSLDVSLKQKGFWELGTLAMLLKNVLVVKEVRYSRMAVVRLQISRHPYIVGKPASQEKWLAERGNRLLYDDQIH